MKPSRSTRTNPAVSKPGVYRSRFTGSTVETVVVPSGVKLRFEDDSEAILRFIGLKDIQELVEGATAPCIYLTFTDGRKIVSVSQTFKLTKVKWTEGSWYYLHAVGLVETSLNPMVDFEVERLGVSGDTIKFDNADATLSDEWAAEMNYNGPVNYPLK